MRGGRKHGGVKAKIFHHGTILREKEPLSPLPATLTPLGLLKWAKGGIRSRSTSSVDSDSADANHNITPPKKRSGSLGKCPQLFFIFLVIAIVLIHCVVLVFLPAAHVTSTDELWTLQQYGIPPIQSALPEVTEALGDCVKKPKCAHSVCLKSLANHNRREPRESVFSHHLRAEINYIRGDVHNVHMDIIAHFTDMQWSRSVYGSLVEFGSHLGKFSAILAVNFIPSAGEKIFVMDNFSRLIKSNKMNEQLSHFFSFLESKGFQLNSAAPERQFLVQDSLRMDASLLQRLQVPKFRIFSVGVVEGYSEVVHVLLQSVCWLQEGAIVVIDGIHAQKTKNHVHTSIVQFINDTDMVPLLAAENKLYMCSKVWKAIYTTYLLSRQDIISSFALKASTDSVFGTQSTYFIID